MATAGVLWQMKANADGVHTRVDTLHARMTELAAARADGAESVARTVPVAPARVAQRTPTRQRPAGLSKKVVSVRAPAAGGSDTSAAGMPTAPDLHAWMKRYEQLHEDTAGLAARLVEALGARAADGEQQQRIVSGRLDALEVGRSTRPTSRLVKLVHSTV